MGKNSRRNKGRETRAILTERFPLCFQKPGQSSAKRPLAIGIFGVIRERCPDLSGHAISAALNDYTSGQRYAAGNSAGAVRVDLDGNDAGIVSEDQAKFAVLRATSRREYDTLQREIRDLRMELIMPRHVLWACHVRGPDDLIPTPDYASAVGIADTINKNDGNGTLRAVPMLWPGSADEHAIAINEGASEYKWAQMNEPAVHAAA